MKRFFTCLLALMLVVGLTACDTTADAPQAPVDESPAGSQEEVSTEPVGEAQGEGTYTPGTYTAERQGNGGMVPVTVEFSDSAILSVTIGDNSETDGIATPVFDAFPGLIVDNQSLNIDAVSGATVTSVAVLDAVADCVEQAGGDVAALKAKALDAATAGEAIERTVDVVVVGGGGAGLAAAVSARENGASVVLIEKGAALGGNTLRAGGAYNAVDPVRQAAVDMDASQVTELEEILTVDPATIHEEYRDTLATLQGQIEEYLAGDTTKLFDTVELHTYQTYTGGWRTGQDGSDIYSKYELASTLTSNSLDAYEWLVSHSDTVEITDNIDTVLGGLWPRMHSLNVEVGQGFIAPLETYCRDNDVEIILNTTAQELIVEDGRVVGVSAVQSDGTPVTLKAENGVVMATGGYGANPAMAMEYDNYWGVIHEDMPTTNSTLSTGDGIEMGKAAGASLIGMGYIQLMPSSQPVTGSLGGGLWTGAEHQVFVNREGKRFVSEYESRDVLSKAALEQTDATFYIICDQITAGDPQPGGKNGWGNDIDTLIADGDVLKADTLEELAEQIGCDPAVLVAEIERYNSFTETGVDEDYNKVKLGDPIVQAPFYATIRTPSIHHTMGGLEINADAQVLDESGSPIPGFYAAGEVTGGVHAGNRVGGNAIPDIMVFGRIAGSSAAAAR